MGKHTSTPWKVLPDQGEGLAVAPRKPQGHCVGLLYKSNPNAESDAAYIVRAVNAHEALVSAAEQAITLVARAQAEGAFEGCAMRTCGLKGIELLEGALRLARGESA